MEKSDSDFGADKSVHRCWDCNCITVIDAVKNCDLHMKFKWFFGRCSMFIGSKMNCTPIHWQMERFPIPFHLIIGFEIYFFFQ